jgi:pimeloyl-ACP methyl ester carboxylesterase
LCYRKSDSSWNFTYAVSAIGASRQCRSKEARKHGQNLRLAKKENTMAFDTLNLADCRIAYQRQVGNENVPGVVFLSGFASDMEGTKATFVSQKCSDENISFVRFDYRGCGKSSGVFSEWTIGAWLEDSLAIFDLQTTGPQIVVGSSMGGWLGLLLSSKRPSRVKAFIGVAAAPDFTEDLVWNKLTPPEQESLLRDGYIYERDDVDKRAPISRTLIEEGRQHLVLRQPLNIQCPVRLLQGMNDHEVPWELAPRIASHVSSNDVLVTLVKNGDHSLSSEDNLELLWQTIASVR